MLRVPMAFDVVLTAGLDVGVEILAGGRERVLLTVLLAVTSFAG